MQIDLQNYDLDWTTEVAMTDAVLRSSVGCGEGHEYESCTRWIMRSAYNKAVKFCDTPFQQPSLP